MSGGEYEVSVKIGAIARSPRAAAEEALEDLRELLAAGKVHLVTVTEVGTDAETVVDMSEPVSGLELEFDRKIEREGR